MANSLPAIKHPCKDCPFRKDSLPGWLGESRSKEISECDSFVCHKTTGVGKEKKQCAGFMLVRGHNSTFLRLATSLGHDLQLTGRELVFQTEKDFIKHHTNKHYKSK